MLKKSIKINAPVEKVWNAILSYRSSDSSKRSILSCDGNKAVIAEKFGNVPIIGASRVVYEEVEKPFDRIDYSLVESDSLSRFEGSWVLNQGADGHTYLVLTNTSDSHLPIPFKEAFLKTEAEKDMDGRLRYVKQKAESDKS